MSHFTVTVFGDNPEDLLAPFDESIEMERYENGRVDEERLIHFKEHCIKENSNESNLSMEELYKIHGIDWNNNFWEKDGDTWYEFSSYNPDSKWDWYQIGGRWAGYFKLKNGSKGSVGVPGLGTDMPENGYADVLLKKDIDIEFMRNDQEEKAAIIYDKAKVLIDKYGDGFIPWSKVMEDKIITEEQRSNYHNQPLVKAFKERVEDFGFMVDIESFMVSRKSFLQTARDSAISTFAFITSDGEWVEKGSMGWWGCVSDEKDSNDWNKIFSDYFDSLPDNTRITLVDCHI